LSALRSTLEAAFGEITRTSSQHIRGTRSEDFDEFIRRFERKYRTVIMNEQVLIDILGVRVVEPSEMPLVGNMATAWAHMMDMRVPAILDTGSIKDGTLVYVAPKSARYKIFHEAQEHLLGISVLTNC
uniref:Transcriptional regulator n=1 Tax=Haemonchus placei TaxID=6290 RepID=A0A0N4WSK7_HAEPC